MSVLRVRDLDLRYDRTQVFRNIWFTLDDRERVGLIGANASGKTALLKVILGRDEPTGGQVDVDRDARIGYFSQFSELDDDVPIERVMRSRRPDLVAPHDELERVEQAMGEDQQDLATLIHRQAELHAELDRLGGWDLDHQVDVILTRLGFRAEDRAAPVSQLSGGWRNRAALAAIVMEEPDVLLLDEPTNFLDVEGLAWLEQWLRTFRGAAIVVSHDRHFLDTVVTRIVEIENYALQEYGGNFTTYVREKPLRLKSLDRQYRDEEELLVYEAEAIADRREAKRNPSKALARKLANIKKQQAPRPVDRVVTDIYAGLKVPEKLLEVDGIWKAYGDKTLFAELSFELARGERLAVIGPNGSGKTTLLETLIGEEEPDAGTIRWRMPMEPAAFEAIVAGLDPNESVSYTVNTAPLAYHAARKKVHRFLAMLRFSDADLAKKVRDLSGGQRARVGLAVALMSGSGVLVLDEPTNHLDIPSAQVMERALAHFPGAVIVVSHDRFFIDKVATKLVVLDGNGGSQLVEGNWTMWEAAKR